MSSTTTTTTNPPKFEVKATDWDRTAASYAQLASQGSPMSVPITKLVEMLQTLSSFDTATTILDIGCGPGSATSHLISTHHDILPSNTQILATDFSRGMISIVQQVRDFKLEKLSEGTEKSTWSRVVPLVMDAQDLRPLLDDSISHIIANFVLFMVDDPQKALQEAHRVLKSGGVFVLSSWHRMDWMDCLVIAASNAFPTLGKPTPQLPKFPAQWASVDGVRDLLKDAGFKDVQVNTVGAPIIMPKVEASVHAFLTSGNPAVTWITDVLEEKEIEEVEKQLVKVVKEKCGVNDNGGYVLNGTAILASCRK
ncbi:S-adenosyl-L-methionine-dependent methyltransferase, partial [Aureobasidium melanogenum]|uniref:S-adenosyl-L-methionine-dependent methyltransferase n=1 Tax=Aureobasidium melanogenum (strain CBS 110374) TaxID=1043003 RepID=A0A074X043_AURM1